jgi:hypothetical protein
MAAALKCWGTNSRITRKLDATGNTVESASHGVGYQNRETFRFEYDPQGDWIRRVTTMYLSASQPPRISDLVVRQISYCP